MTLKQKWLYCQCWWMYVYLLFKLTAMTNSIISDNDRKAYERNIKNAKMIKKKLEKSGMRPELLKSINYIIDNYKLEDEAELWIYDYCNREKIHHPSMMGCISRPFKIKSFNDLELWIVKKWIENWCVDRMYKYGTFDYSISVSGKEKAFYNAEYKGCGNWHYYLMLDHETAMWYEDD